MNPFPKISSSLKSFFISVGKGIVSLYTEGFKPRFFFWRYQYVSRKQVATNTIMTLQGSFMNMVLCVSLYIMLFSLMVCSFNKHTLEGTIIGVIHVVIIAFVTYILFGFMYVRDYQTAIVYQYTLDKLEEDEADLARKNKELDNAKKKIEKAMKSKAASKSSSKKTTKKVVKKK